MPADPEQTPSKHEPDDDAPEASSPPCYAREFSEMKIGSDEKAGQPGEDEPTPANELTPEEQMERFEKELKETDWGHQPC